ncbi:hypothetical protein HDU83_005482 [Entophlyctis luteolus]|nr:hypothetical protein HDU83_005482 [Entophlyctis luteolus]
MIAATALSPVRYCADANSLCINVALADSSEFVIISVQAARAGYAAIAFDAKSMEENSGYTYLGWKHQDETLISRRKLTGHVMPEFVESISSLPVLATLSSEEFSTEYAFAIPAAEISAGKHAPLQCIYSMSDTPGGDAPSSDIAFHDTFGSFTIDLRDILEYVPLADNSTSPINDGPDYLAIHGWLMALAWCVLTPTAIFIGRYYKTALGHTWYILHKYIMVGGVMVLTMAALMMVDLSEHLHDDQASSSLIVVHTTLGRIVFFVMFAQIALGFVINWLFQQSRTAVPWHDKLHHYLGRGLMAAALINVFLGLTSYGAPKWAYVLYVVYLCGLSFAFWFFGEKKFGGAVNHISSLKNASESFLYEDLSQEDDREDSFEMEERVTE